MNLHNVRTYIYIYIALYIYIYTTEFLNSLEPFGMPPHTLQLKVGFPVTVLRNVDPPRLCNGTRCVVKKLMRNCIEVTIMFDLIHHQRKLHSVKIILGTSIGAGCSYSCISLKVQLSWVHRRHGL